MAGPTGFFIPQWNFGQTKILAWIYHCNVCETTYKFLTHVSDKCPICMAPIDRFELYQLEKEYKDNL